MLFFPQLDCLPGSTRTKMITISLLCTGYSQIVFSEETQVGHTAQYSGMLVCVHELTHQLSSCGLDKEI